jgi:hypothetical protein
MLAPIGIGLIPILGAAGVDVEKFAARGNALAIVNALAWLVAGPVVGLFAFRGRLDKLALGFRTVVDTALDVDNYLREHPVKSNPRSRICARYSSLLRYLCAWRDGDGEDAGGYDALLIVAHSQGTVITADLLRYLKLKREIEPGPEDRALNRLTGEDLPVYLFTMGCPLRQLYGLRFPFLYQWARFLPVPAGVDDHGIIPPDRVPLTDDLRVKKWVNAYRSGDYVGRQLWRPENASGVWTPSDVMQSAGGERKEFCIGPGAHIHYWDKTAPAIVREIDSLLRELAGF